MGFRRRSREELFDILGAGFASDRPAEAPADETAGTPADEPTDEAGSLFADLGDEPIVVVDRLDDLDEEGPRSLELRLDTLVVGGLLAAVCVALAFLLGRSSAPEGSEPTPDVTPMVAVDGSSDLVAAAAGTEAPGAAAEQSSPPSVDDLDVARGRSNYVIQVLTTTDREEAEEAVGWLVDQGYASAHLAPVGGRFVVRIGGFSERDRRALEGVQALSWRNRRLDDAFWKRTAE